MALFRREDILEKLRAKVASGKPIVGGGAGTGISAKMAEAGGIDLLIIYNSGRFRMGGRGSMSGLMPYGDANAIVMEMAREVIPVVRVGTPCVQGILVQGPKRSITRHQFTKRVGAPRQRRMLAVKAQLHAAIFERAQEHVAVPVLALPAHLPVKRPLDPNEVEVPNGHRSEGPQGLRDVEGEAERDARR